MSRSTTSRPEHERRAVVDTRLTHDVHRRATSVLAAAANDSAVPDSALVELRDFLVTNLHHHHQSEDDVLWPMIVNVAPSLADELKDLGAEHDRLAAALDELNEVPIGVADGRAPLVRAATAVRDLVHTHLAREDDLLLPVLQAHLTDHTWDAFAREVVATAPPTGTHLMIGFLDQVGTLEQVALVLLALPDEAKPLLPALREQARATLDALHVHEYEERRRS